MDSPVIVDSASKFRRGIDLDHSFLGFPFDVDEDDSFGRRGDGGIRAHLDDLASRHPELAEHLLGPPWGEAPFHNSLLRGRHRRRESGNSNSSGQHGHQVDEDARSQASGSSAASGASAVSSRSGGEPNTAAASVPSTSIPHYGLRNTVDIGQQQRRDMENMEKNERGQRSMSAPPENRQQQHQPEQQPQSANQPPRFVSRVDITPQHNKQQQQRVQSPKPTPPLSQSSTVRHIPIFVEGRDEPVMPRVRDDASPPPQPPPSSFQRQPSPPHFHRPSYFNDHHQFGRQQWPPSHFQNMFSTAEPSFDEPPMRRHQQQPFYQPQYHQQKQQPQYQQQQQQPQYYQQQQPQQQQQQPQYHQQQHQQPQYHQQQQNQQPQPQQEILKPKPPVPKDPLEKVAQVQEEVDNLAEQVRRYVGSRQDKEYVYLDEMLTRELIKLDDIETEGRENVRLARKNAIKSIQDTISLLETKAPLAGQRERSFEEKEKECIERERQEGIPRAQSMEVDTKQEKKQGNEPIPLPPAPVPLSPTKTKTESSVNESNAIRTIIESTDQSVAPAKQDNERTDMATEKNTEKRPVALTDEPQRAEETMIAKEPKTSDGNEAMQTTEKDNAVRTTTEPTVTALEEKASKGGSKTQADGQSQKELPRLQKKTKKTKKQQQQQSSPPVSEQAIPLPPPPPTESAK